jgi:hypothetical protein
MNEMTNAAAGRIRELLAHESGIFRSQEEADLRAVLDEREQLAKRVAELEGEREAWREGVATRLEQHLPGQKVVLTLVPKDQCPAEVDIYGVRCERISHDEKTLHRARYGNGHVEWMGHIEHVAHLAAMAADRAALDTEDATGGAQ